MRAEDLHGPAERTIVSVFEHQAAKTPHAPAVTSGADTIDYAVLRERSSALARALVGAGVGTGDRVGVNLDRGIDLIVALLAVLKAGAAYVPLDPGYPAQRLDFVVEDTGIEVVVAREGDRGPAGALVIPVSASAGPAISRDPRSDDVAYVIHTSGSTGKPKGVLVPHRTVIALLDATAGRFGFSGEDVWTLFHSFAFDFSVWEIWACLLTGGRLVVVPRWTARDPGEFHALLAHERVTVLNQTPSAFTQLVSTPGFSGGGLAVRLLVFGGEPLDVRTLTPWFERYPAVRVENMYGITETTVHVTSRTLTAADVGLGTRSVGRPLPGWTIRLLDEAGEPVPAGEPGEIYVGGAGVALGYLNRPELTAQRFLPSAEGTMYRSGDKGRELPDGEFEHLGRLDEQVKIGGHRIELGEVRAALIDDAAVSAAAVLPRDSTSLDAYVVTTEPEALGALRRRLAARLPAYLVPDTLTAIAELPLSPNGKVDTAKLPKPAGAAVATTSAADSLEVRMTALWENVLGVSVAGGDNFFELGGNSLLAARLANEMSAAGLATVSMRELYTHSSLGAMTELVRSQPEVTP